MTVHINVIVLAVIVLWIVLLAFFCGIGVGLNVPEQTASERDADEWDRALERLNRQHGRAYW